MWRCFLLWGFGHSYTWPKRLWLHGIDRLGRNGGNTTTPCVGVAQDSKKARVSAVDPVVPPNSALQRTGWDKVLGRGRARVLRQSGRFCARVLMRQRPAAELGR